MKNAAERPGGNKTSQGALGIIHEGKLLTPAEYAEITGKSLKGKAKEQVSDSGDTAVVKPEQPKTLEDRIADLEVAAADAIMAAVNQRDTDAKAWRSVETGRLLYEGQTIMSACAQAFTNLLTGQHADEQAQKPLHNQPLEVWIDDAKKMREQQAMAEITKREWEAFNKLGPTLKVRLPNKYGQS